jgi:hypothetical protein
LNLASEVEPSVTMRYDMINVRKSSTVITRYE